MSNKTGSCTCNPTEKTSRYSEIDKVIELYKDKRGSLIQILHLAQEIYGHLPLDLGTVKIFSQNRFPFGSQ